MTAYENYKKLQDTMHNYSAWVQSSALHILKFLDVPGKNVVDFGCGRGDWLKVAQELGARSVLGLDTYALDASDLPIPTLRVDLTKPLILEEKYDIAICLEVGEHLEAEYAAVLVESLVKSAPIVLFSAAVPGQGGVHHVNEQPPGYWHSIFHSHAYRCYDFRKEIWNIPEIEPWYRMGALVYVAPDHDIEALKDFFVESPLHLVHPDIFEAYAPIGKDLILHYDTHLKRWHPEILS